MKQVYLGAMGWSYNFWPIYENASSNEYLQSYSNHFNSVEINSTFYGIPRKSSVEKWRDQTPEGFVFSVKIPRSISHSSSLNYDPEKLDAFLDHIKPFRKKLGPLLLQLPPKLSPEHSEQLETLLRQLQKHWITPMVAIAMDTRFDHQRLAFSGAPTRQLPANEDLSDLSLATTDINVFGGVAFRL